MKTAVIFNKKTNGFIYQGSDNFFHPLSHFGFVAPSVEGNEEMRDVSLRPEGIQFYVDCSAWDEQFMDEIPMQIISSVQRQWLALKAKLDERSEWASRGARPSDLSYLVGLRQQIAWAGDVLAACGQALESGAFGPWSELAEYPALDADGEPVKYGVWRAE